nr:hypothetical protein [Tanacetum cinerariifolium]
MAPKRTTRSTPVITTPAPETTTSVTNAQLQAMIDQGMQIGMAMIAILQERTTNPEAAHAMPWRTLKKMMTDKYCPRGEIKKLESKMWNLKEEIDKVEKYVDGLPDTIHGSVMATKPKTMQDAIEFSIELMNKKINTWAERNGERKEYVRTLPLCNKCKFHHNGQCTIKCANYKRVGHLTRDCRSPAATNNHRNPSCYECRNQGHYKSDCPELKNQDHGNQAGGTRAHGMVHALEGG